MSKKQKLSGYDARQCPRNVVDWTGQFCRDVCEEDMSRELFFAVAFLERSKIKSQSCRHEQMFEKRNNPEHPDELMIKNFVMD